MLPATIEWKDGRLLLLDQRQLPSRTEYVSCESAEETARAIENMTVRGAPAIGVAAAYGLVLALKGEDFAAAARKTPSAVPLPAVASAPALQWVIAAPFSGSISCPKRPILLFISISSSWMFFASFSIMR